MINVKKSLYLLPNLITVLLFLLLPYLLFKGNLFIGGDDTRLIYSYPMDFLKNISFYSWFNFSSLSYFNPNHYFIPFSILWGGLESIVNSKAVISYFAFSLPLIIGFLYMQKFLRELLEKDENSLLYIASIFYILSPILIITQISVFLTSVWLIGLFPIFGFYLLKYVKTNKPIHLFKICLWSIFLSFSLYAIPWIVALVIPILLGMIVTQVLYTNKKKIIFLKRSIIFFASVLFTQTFWILPFLSTFIYKNSLVDNVISIDAYSIFVSNVISTGTGNILYPLLNLFHRQIIIDHNWQVNSIYLSYYDPILIINIVFIGVLLFGIFNFKRNLTKSDGKLFLVFLSFFILSLFFFTVNIGFLKEVFLLLGKIPGIIMFKNFYDKFAIGYIFIYSIVLYFSLIIIKKSFKKKILILNLILLVVIFINAIPFAKIVNLPLWTTSGISKNIKITKEYKEFMDRISRDIPKASTVLTLPFNIAAYSFIKGENENEYYVGTSPLKIFTGVNDISGNLSFNSLQAKEINDAIIKKKSNELKEILYKYNVNYIFNNKSVNDELKGSYLFLRKNIQSQDDDFLRSIVGNKLFESKEGTYEVFEIQKRNTIIQSKNVFFQKINPVKYRIYIKNLVKTQKLIFLDTFHSGWNIYLKSNPNLNWCNIERKVDSVIECKSDFSWFEFQDVGHTFEKPLFASSHEKQKDFGNSWEIDSKEIDRFGKQYFKLNKDGSIDVELILYFIPQNYFYLGIFISVISLILVVAYVFKNKT